MIEVIVCAMCGNARHQKITWGTQIVIADARIDYEPVSLHCGRMRKIGVLGPDADIESDVAEISIVKIDLG